MLIHWIWIIWNRGVVVVRIVGKIMGLMGMWCLIWGIGVFVMGVRHVRMRNWCIRWLVRTGSLIRKIMLRHNVRNHHHLYTPHQFLYNTPESQMLNPNPNPNPNTKIHHLYSHSKSWTQNSIPKIITNVNR